MIFIVEDMKLFIVIVCFHGLIISESTTIRTLFQGAQCPTSSECTVIRDCPAMLELLRRPTKKGMDTLRNSVCGRQNERSKVCCPSLNLKQNTGTIVISSTHQPQEHTNKKEYNATQTSLLPEMNCGLGGITDVRIVGAGGVPVRLGQAPWMAVLGFTTEGREPPVWGCGGTLISDRYVLTAAHCTHKEHTKQMDLTVVRLGENNLYSRIDCRRSWKQGGPPTVCAPLPLDFRPEALVMHPQFNTRAILSDDIALVRLDRRVSFTEFINPICLASVGETVTSLTRFHTAHMIGWGDTEFGARSAQLLKVPLPVVPIETCRKIANYHITLVKGGGQLCFGGSHHQSACSKDSGGPAVVIDFGKKRFPIIQIGIVSYGSRVCGAEGLPDVFTDVSFYHQWIVRNMRP